MCAGKFRILLWSIAAVSISDGCVSAADAATVSTATAKTETVSIPTANKPLPQNSAVADQKPTSAAPAISSVVKTNWTIAPKDSALGDRKPAQCSLIAAPTSSNPEPVPATVIVDLPKPTANPPSAELFRSGVQKPTLDSAPPVSEITQVQWSAESRSANSHKTIQPGFDFRADCCPFVLWNPDAHGEYCSDAIIDRSPIGSCSDLTGTFAEDTAGRVFLASLTPEATGGLDPSDLAALKQLQPLSNGGEFSAGSYLTDLNQLLQGESSWIFGNEQLLDLAPEEGSGTTAGYLEDLNALVRSQASSESGHAQYRRTVASQDTAPPEPMLPPQKTPGERYRAIAPDPACDAVGVRGISFLFQPMSSIQVAGLSTSPPEIDPTAEEGESTELDRPENQACVYMENATPVYYFPPTRFGVCRPSRNTHALHHNPLYYEDPNLERCGQGHGCLTTAVSAVHFGTAIAFTPYLTAATCPNTCVCALPDCPTCHSFGHDAYCPGWSWKGAAAQAAAVTGLYFVIP